MRTETRLKILKIIGKKGDARPNDLVKELGITPQAVHRHLRSLVETGVLVSRDKGPRVRYFIANMPRLNGVLAWYGSLTAPPTAPEGMVCETRDVFTGRLNGLVSLQGPGPDELSLVISATAEVGNNCFDHNLGRSRDIPGCWFEIQPSEERSWICIADRGQGVFRSLSRIDPSLPDEQTALVAAFERRLSGRAPEQRGNGLKFVRHIMEGRDGRGIACRSGAGLVGYGPLGEECRRALEAFPAQSFGTITLMEWRWT
jgi:hypothetical protein